MGSRSRFRGGTGRLTFAWNGPVLGLPGERKQMNHLQRTRRLTRFALSLELMVAAFAAYPAAAQAAGTLKKPPTAHIGAAWGSNLNGHLGNGNGVSSSTYVTVSGPRNIAQISDGNSSSLAVTTDGSVYAWGYNGYGELGTGDQTNYPSPQLVAGLSGGAARWRQVTPPPGRPAVRWPVVS